MQVVFKAIIWPLFDGSISSECYMNLILGPFFQELVDEEKTGYFVQDSATACMAD
jgi:hypothetical protein